MRCPTLIAGVLHTSPVARIKPCHRARPISLYRGLVPTCSFCGRSPREGESTLTWTTAFENGKSRTFCDTCSREHLRAMESKLDSEWW